MPVPCAKFKVLLLKKSVLLDLNKQETFGNGQIYVALGRVVIHLVRT